MLGAIIGDIAGSKFEFSPNLNYDLDLFGESHDFTDDTICTIGVAAAILSDGDYKNKVSDWCKKYPNPMGGYGASFMNWVYSDNPKPYNSFGNGSAMRVSPVAWAFDERERVVAEARKTAEISHNHPEGIKGAKTVALAIWLARQNKSVSEIIDECKSFSNYNLNISGKPTVN